MEEIEESKELAKYNVNINPEALVEIYVDKWVLKWCKEYHPEAFDAANKVIREFLDKDDEKTLDK